MIKEQLLRYLEEVKGAIQDLKTKGKRKNQIPNILTSLRLLAPFFILPASFTGNVPLVLTFVGVFSVTDLLDGWIARTFHLTSNLGRDLDAFCDKLFAGTLLLGASFIHPMLLCNLGLELAITEMNVRAKLEGLEPKSLIIGKLKTFFLFSLLGVSFISPYVSLDPLFYTMLGTTLTLQGATAFSYQEKYKKIRKLKKKQQEVETLCTELATEEEKENEKVKEPEIHLLSPREQKIETLKGMKEVLTQEVLLDKTDEKEEEKPYQLEKVSSKKDS